MPEHVRKYIYALLTPAAAIAVFYGLVSESEVALWLALAGTGLMVGSGGLAAANTGGSGLEGDHEWHEVLDPATGAVMERYSITRYPQHE